MSERFLLTEEEVVRGYDARGRARAERLDRVLARRFPEVSRAELTRWIKEGLVTKNGAPVKPSDSARAGDELCVQRGAPQLSAAVPDPSVVLDVVYEDEHLVVVDKPAGLVVHPAAGHPTGTLVNGLLARPGFEAAPIDPRDPAGYLRPGIVHRLDRDTSGLLVVAKHAEAREGLKRQFTERSVAREYEALTIGVPTQGVIETMHARSPVHRRRFTSLTESGRQAVTTVTLLMSFGHSAKVCCRLQTGRTHQIRVHLLEQRRTPILGDVTYCLPVGDERLLAIGRELGRQALHATTLGFTHPITGEAVSLRREPPADFQRAQQALAAL